MNDRLMCAILCGVILPVLIPSAAAADVAALAQGCNECHGADGVSSEGDVPTIAGMSAFVIEDYLLTYQDRARPCHETEYRSGDLDRPPTSMCEIADQLDDGEIAAIAEHYSGKPFVPAEQEFDAAKAAAGAAVHRRDCEKCHTDNASNAEDDAGIMAGQWMPYLKQIFDDYSTGEREMVEDKMRDKFDGLTDEEKDQLIHFYASLQ